MASRFSAKLTHEHEEMLWDKQHLSMDTSVGLMQAVVFYLIKSFGVCQGKDLKLLKTGHVSFGRDQLGQFVVVNLEAAIGGGKVMKRYDDPSNPRSVYKILKTYRGYVVNEGPFLVRPLSAVKDYICYTPYPLGVGFLEQLVFNLMLGCGFTNYFCNFSVCIMAIDILKSFGTGVHCLSSWLHYLILPVQKQFVRDTDNVCSAINCEELNEEARLVMSHLLDPPYPSPDFLASSKSRNMRLHRPDLLTHHNNIQLNPEPSHVSDQSGQVNLPDDNLMPSSPCGAVKKSSNLTNKTKSGASPGSVKDRNQLKNVRSSSNGPLSSQPKQPNALVKAEQTLGNEMISPCLETPSIEAASLPSTSTGVLGTRLQECKCEVSASVENGQTPAPDTDTLERLVPNSDHAAGFRKRHLEESDEMSEWQTQQLKIRKVSARNDQSRCSGTGHCENEEEITSERVPEISDYNTCLSQGDSFKGRLNTNVTDNAGKNNSGSDIEEMKGKNNAETSKNRANFEVKCSEIPDQSQNRITEKQFLPQNSENLRSCVALQQETDLAISQSGESFLDKQENLATLCCASTDVEPAYTSSPAATTQLSQSVLLSKLRCQAKLPQKKYLQQNQLHQVELPRKTKSFQCNLTQGQVALPFKTNSRHKISRATKSFVQKKSDSRGKPVTTKPLVSIQAQRQSLIQNSHARLSAPSVVNNVSDSSATLPCSFVSTSTNKTVRSGCYQISSQEPLAQCDLQNYSDPIVSSSNLSPVLEQTQSTSVMASTNMVSEHLAKSSSVLASTSVISERLAKSSSVLASTSVVSERLGPEETSSRSVTSVQEMYQKKRVGQPGTLLNKRNLGEAFHKQLKQTFKNTLKRRLDRKILYNMTRSKSCGRRCSNVKPETLGCFQHPHLPPEPSQPFRPSQQPNTGNPVSSGFYSNKIDYEPSTPFPPSQQPITGIATTSGFCSNKIDYEPSTPFPLPQQPITGIATTSGFCSNKSDYEPSPPFPLPQQPITGNATTSGFCSNKADYEPSQPFPPSQQPRSGGTTTSGFYSYKSDYHENVARQVVVIHKSSEETESFIVPDLSLQDQRRDRGTTTSELCLGDYFPPGTLLPMRDVHLVTRQGPLGLEVVLQFGALGSAQ